MTTKKPPAEVVGSFADWLRRGECDDGRELFVFEDSGDWDDNHHNEVFVLAVSKIRAWEALHPEIGSIVKMTKTKLTERTTQEVLKLMEEQNSERQTE